MNKNMNNNMNNKMIDEMPLEELKKIEKDIKEGRFLAAIERRIKSLSETKICAVCGEKVSEDRCFVLFFGPSDLRKKAHFCALDCLQYFTDHIKAEGENKNSYY
jgi:hypothetical protein